MRYADAGAVNLAAVDAEAVEVAEQGTTTKGSSHKLTMVGVGWCSVEGSGVGSVELARLS